MTLDEKIELANRLKEKVSQMAQFIALIEKSKWKKSAQLKQDSLPTRFWFEASVCTGTNNSNYEARITDRETLDLLTDSMLPALVERKARLESELGHLFS